MATFRWLVRLSKLFFILFTIVSLCCLLSVLSPHQWSVAVEAPHRLADIAQPAGNQLPFKTNTTQKTLGYSTPVDWYVHLGANKDIWNLHNRLYMAGRLWNHTKHNTVDKDAPLLRTIGAPAVKESVQHMHMSSPGLSHTQSIVWKGIPESYTVNCSKLFNGDQAEMSRAMTLTEGDKADLYLQRSTLTEPQLLQLTSDCPQFLTTRSYMTSPPSPEEADFPLAFSLLVYEAAGQVERLLRAIYRPHNLYCIHVDEKSPATFKQAMEALASCLPNVFVSSVSTEVSWGGYGVLEAELICMKELLSRSSSTTRPWMYYINLTGHEFPLKTNLDVVRVLRTLAGGNDIYGRIKSKYRHRWLFSHLPGEATRTKPPPPHNITIYKGSTHILVSRAFTQFILADLRVQDFLHWVKDTHFPEETFFPSVQHNPHLGAPGAYTAEALSASLPRHQVARYKQWRGMKGRPCHGVYVRNICLQSLQDLPALHSTHTLYLNKLLPQQHQQQGYVHLCLEELLVGRVRGEEEQRGRGRVPDGHLNMTYVQSLTIVKHHM